ncbi:HAD-IA family hydrolase [Bacillus sp. FJAT-50079]|uniref:HAD family hydrolase n=1 Tax=Bacillus sp. FJAT-50079 TaxID=2833577 RepID=UPI001BC8D320|nr:HAD-IA family hydrolase [Bacillus sp. FJAT-50079]MBS4206612.1 HAD-IA family hydrolase [Bacillus sp. FJAT-50079]
MIKSVIFDFDGLILDTETAIIKAYEEFYNEHQLIFPIKEWGKNIGGAMVFDPYETLLTHYPTENKKNLESQFNKRYQLLLEGTVPREGVIDYLKRAREIGLRTAVASSSSKDWIETHMKRLGIRDYFDFICTADDVSKIKPDPELYQTVLDYFNIHPNEAVVFEDSPNGSLAAIKAGIPCVIVPNEATKILTFDERVLFKMKSKNDMTLDEVIKRVVNFYNK